ncbi:TPA: hypothetical protein EYP75_02850 [Candidatus Bathyarchaeota archaeon]|nr:hypothetical protein [Candidatus Bathyarchaeota archaeon]
MTNGKKVRTTLVLDEAVVKKLRQKSRGNMSKLVNEILKEALFQKGKSMFGELKGLVSTKDIVEEEVHEELYR